MRFRLARPAVLVDINGIGELNYVRVSDGVLAVGAIARDTDIERAPWIGDRALWNRLKLIPFDVVIPKEKQLPRHEVMEMFRTEFPGILNWAIEGCLEWQRWRCESL